jgi:hypothetical protein
MWDSYFDAREILAMVEENNGTIQQRIDAIKTRCIEAGYEEGVTYDA